MLLPQESSYPFKNHKESAPLKEGSVLPETYSQPDLNKKERDPKDYRTTVLIVRQDLPEDGTEIEHYFDKIGILIRASIKSSIISTLNQSLPLVKDILKEKLNKIQQVATSIINLFELIQKECLENIYLIHNVKKGNIDQLANFIQNNESSSITHFTIENRYSDPEMLKIVNAFRKSKMTKLKTFELIYGQIWDTCSEPKNFPDLVKNNVFSELENLIFRYGEMRSAHMTSVIKAFVDKKHDKLKEITLQYNTGDTDTAQAIASGFSQKLFINLETLCISNLGITHDLLKFIVRSMTGDCCPKLKSLDLNDNRLGESGASELFEMIQDNTFQLESLSLGASGLITNDIGEYGINKLSECIYKNRLDSLIKLQLDANNIGDKGAVTLISSLSNLKNIRFLNIGANNIHEEGGVIIGQLITDIPSLIKLELGNNYLGQSVSSLNNIFKNLPFLRYLGLCNNDIPEEIAVELVNNTLNTIKDDSKYLDLSQNDLNENTVKSTNNLLFVVI